MKKQTPTTYILCCIQCGKEYPFPDTETFEIYMKKKPHIQPLYRGVEYNVSVFDCICEQCLGIDNK